MGIVRCFSIDGVHMWFPSGDHESPHFHARKSDKWYAKVFFEKSGKDMLKPISGKMFRGDRQAIIESVEENRLELLKEWERWSEV